MKKVETTYIEIWNLAYPIMLGGIAQTALNVIDTSFLARVGEVELAASALGGVFYFVLIMMAFGVGVGIQILISRHAGEGNLKAISVVFSNGMVMVSGLAFIMFMMTWLFAGPLFSLIIEDANIEKASLTLIYSRSFGMLATIPALGIRAFFTGFSHTRIISVQAILAAAVNTMLDYTLIFGHFGFEPMGIKGAGIASAIAEVVAGTSVFVYAAYYMKHKKYDLFHFSSVSWSQLKRIGKVSSPIVMQNFMSMSAWFVFFVFIEKAGTHSLAISNIIRTAYMIFMTPVWGFSSAANSMVSNLIGQKKNHDVFLLLSRIILLSIAILTVVAVVSAIFPEQVLKLMTNDNKLISDSLNSYYIICVTTVVLGVAANLLSGVSGTGATQAALFIEIISIVGYLIYIYLTCLVYKTDVAIVWLSEIIYWILISLFSFAYLKSGRWKHLKI